MLPARGDFDHWIIACGVPRSGKSTWAVKRALGLAREVGGAYVIAHDPGGRMPSPAGVDVRRHATAEACRASLAVHPNAIQVCQGDVEQTIQLATDTAEASLLRGSGRGHPVILLIDEGVWLEGANAYRLAPQMKRLVASRRWLHCAVVITVQSPTMVHFTLLTLSTEIAIFRLPGHRAYHALVGAGIPEDVARKASSLPMHAYLLHRG